MLDRVPGREAQSTRNARLRQRQLKRAAAVQGMRARLPREGYPRVQMFILMALTGLAGSGASAGMLAAGIETMGLRYLLAMGSPTSSFFRC